MAYTYYVSPEPSNYSRSTASAIQKKPPLVTALRWVSDKAAGTVLDVVLGRFVAGPLYIRVSGAVTTGLLTSFIVWIVADKFLPLLFSHPTAVPVMLAALAGVAMAGGRGLLIGAGVGWLVAILAESSTAEFSKEATERHLNFLWVWCISTIVGGLVGWAAERLVDKLTEKSRILGEVLKAVVYLAVFATVAMTLLGTGVPHALWQLIRASVPDISYRQALIVGAVLAVVSVPFYLWCYAPESVRFSIYLLRHSVAPRRWIRVHLLWIQALLTAMFLTLTAFGPAGKPSFGQDVLVIAVLWTAPWVIITAGKSAGWLTGRVLTGKRPTPRTGAGSTASRSSARFRDDCQGSR